MGRFANTLGGFAAAVSLSQFPEFSQQYVQRLGGAVDELQKVTTDFDETAAGANLTREEALESMTGSEFQDGRQKDMRQTFDRFERLSENYEKLRDADSFTRVTNIRRLADGEIAANTWEDYQPALPINRDGLVFLLTGFFIGYLAIYTIVNLIGSLRRAARNRRIRQAK